MHRSRREEHKVLEYVCVYLLRVRVQDHCGTSQSAVILEPGVLVAQAIALCAASFPRSVVPQSLMMYRSRS